VTGTALSHISSGRSQSYESCLECQWISGVLHNGMYVLSLMNNVANMKD
jgi:hypothetical protein